MLDKIKDKLKGGSSHPPPTTPPQDHKTALDQTHTALDDITTQANDHPVDPQSHLQKPADHPSTYTWLASYFPSSQYLGDLESSYHLGNWVRTSRTTNTTEWEAMSIYVRLGMHALYYGSLQESLLSSRYVIDMLQAQTAKMGRQYDDPRSKDHIVPFIQSFKLDMSEMVQPDPGEYETFNEFFSREIRASARPAAQEGDDGVVSSSADCRLTVWGSVDLATRFWVKGADFTVERLLRDRELAGKFDGGSMAIFRLAPQDYHRWHSPVKGRIVGTREIEGAYYTVNPQAICQKGKLNVYCENRRSVMVVDAVGVGGKTYPVVIVAVGAMLVGSIKYIKNQPGEEIKRAECLGKFEYGGSTVLVLFPPKSIMFDDDLVAWSSGERHGAKGPMETLVKVGEKIGRWI